ncbi:hypothetical protein ET004_03750 [Lactococcus petauri]|uniref:hypothetical protein n=1 Tax=Lactococcus petauri TaxID=1940789 RepID=UPI0013FD5AA4|nr:hypothetical protein [Lactococcus petauri]NHI71365.1 hypothetical protein [Lactococcus petauri]
MKKWYLSTPMNGKTEKEIQASLQRGIGWVKEKGDEYHSPYNPDNATFNDKNEVHDPKPIAMLSKAIEPMDECTGVAFIGDRKILKSSKGCFIEYQIALEYGKEVRFID